MEFHNKILTQMSHDFAEKMGICEWPPEKRVNHGSSANDEVDITLVRTEVSLIVICLKLYQCNLYSHYVLFYTELQSSNSKKHFGLVGTVEQSTYSRCHL